MKSIGVRVSCLALVLLTASLWLPFVVVTEAADSPASIEPTGQVSQFFQLTSHNVGGLFLENFNASGGIAVNGLPLTEEFKDGDGLTIQVFERAIFELHQPLENSDSPQPPPYVEHKLLGVMLTAERNFLAAEASVGLLSSRYFQATHHNLEGAFGSYWDTHGGLAEFGYPISEEFQEVNFQDSHTYIVQYFERARFEYHPELFGTDYAVELGQLGRQYAQVNYEGNAFAAAKQQLLGPQKLVRVPSLMYHHIRELTAPYDSELNNYSVTPEAFVEQMDWLQAHGYHSVTTGQLAAYLKYGVPLPAKPVNIRFDDGWQNQLWAAKELKKRNMTATFYIITQAHTGGYMTIDQIKLLDAQGFEIASHTRSHPFLTRNGPDYDWAQIAGSKADLEGWLGHPVRSFAYPFGDHNPQVDAMVQKAGYDIGATIDWSLNWKASTMLTEPAISMSQMHTMSGFLARININY